MYVRLQNGQAGVPTCHIQLPQTPSGGVQDTAEAHTGNRRRARTFGGDEPGRQGLVVGRRRPAVAWRGWRGHGVRYRFCRRVSFLRLHGGSRVFDRVSALVMKRGPYTANVFVSDHAVRVPYVVRCVASGMGRSDARELRDFLVLLGPSRSAGAGRSIVESEDCWLTDDDEVGDSLPFSEFGSLNLDVP